MSAAPDENSVNESTSRMISDDVDCIDYDPDNEDNLLGIGSYGTLVYRGKYKWPLTQEVEEVAIKRIQKQPRGGFAKELVREVKALQLLSHKNVIKYYHAVETRHFAFVILPLCMGSLINITDIWKDISKKPFPKSWKIHSWPTKKHLLHGVACGLQYVHKKGIIHRDLKPQNILVTNDESDLGLKAVISDFGLSRQFDDVRISLSRSMVGTNGWMAKEVLINNRHTDVAPEPLDAFSYGCLVHFVLSNKRSNSKSHPFGINDLRNNNIKAGKRAVYLYENLTGTSFASQKQSFYGDAILADFLIDICVSSEPKIRPSADDIVNHPFFWNYTNRKQYVCAHFNDLKDDFQNKKATPPMITKLESMWQDVCKGDTQFHDKIPEVWSCVQKFNYNKPPPKHWKSKIFDGLMRLIRNLSEHWNKAVQSEPSLIALFSEFCDDEAIGLYFFEKIPKSFPVIYVNFMCRDAIHAEMDPSTKNGIIDQYRKILVRFK